MAPPQVIRPVMLCQDTHHSALSVETERNLKSFIPTAEMAAMMNGSTRTQRQVDGDGPRADHTQRNPEEQTKNQQIFRRFPRVNSSSEKSIDPWCRRPAGMFCFFFARLFFMNRFGAGGAAGRRRLPPSGAQSATETCNMSLTLCQPLRKGADVSCAAGVAQCDAPAAALSDLPMDRRDMQMTDVETTCCKWQKETMRTGGGGGGKCRMWRGALDSADKHKEWRPDKKMRGTHSGH